MMHKKRVFALLAGPFLFALSLCLPASIFETLQARMAVGTITWMALWWVTAPVDYAVTALLPILLNAVFGMTGMDKVLANYASETILLLLGASILSLSWAETGLDRRIALRFLLLVGGSMRMQLIFWFLLSAFLSALLPNSVVCAMLTPIAAAMLSFAGEGDARTSRKAAKLLMYIAYGTGVGGLATPLGGAMNLVAVDYLSQVSGQEFLYLHWIPRFLPFFLVLLSSNIAFMLRGTGKREQLQGSGEYARQAYMALPQMKTAEKLSLVLFLTAVVLAFGRPFYSSVLPGLKPAYGFLLCAAFTFLIPDDTGRPVMHWSRIQGKILWELVLVFAGGLAAGTLIEATGAAAALGNAVAAIGLSSGLPAVFAITALTILLSDFTSNTATAAIAIPVVISMAKGMGISPIPYIYIAAVGSNLSYMLPTSIRAVPVGYGLSPKILLQEGWKLTLIALFLTTLLGHLFLCFWPLFSAV